jgi:hypothetical protein
MLVMRTLIAGGLCGLAMGCAAPASRGWQVAEQPDLKAQLAAAPALTIEDLAAPARMVTNYPTHLVPNPDGKTWDVLQWYFKGYSGPTWLYAVDLGTGEVKKQRFPDQRDIHLAGTALGPDGKFYMATPLSVYGARRLNSQEWGMEMYVYDPATNTLEGRGIVVPKLGGERYDLVTGPDGKIYGAGSYTEKGVPARAGAYSYDPKTGKVRDYGPVGPDHAPYSAYGYFIAVDDTHIYVASGKIPWYLVAINIETGEDRVILEAPVGNETLWVWEAYPGAMASIGLEQRNPRVEYWLHRGQAIKKTERNEKPPWTPKASALPPEPEIYTGQTWPDAQGRGRLWYRLPEDKPAGAPSSKASRPMPQDEASAETAATALGWKSVTLDGVETYPLGVHRLLLMPDGRIFGTPHWYFGNFIYDPKTSQLTPLLGRTAGCYAYLAHEGHLYWSGYPSGPVFDYDLSKPWTAGISGPPGYAAPALGDAASNPRMWGQFYPHNRVKKVYSGTAAADGNVYFGGEGERDYVGGSLGWFDPKTGKLDGIWKPFSGSRIFWLTPALEGTILVASTKTSPDELNNNVKADTAKLFIYDIKSGEVVRTIEPVSKAEKSGPLFEVAPGRLLGTADNPAKPGAGILYGVDIQTGEVLFRKDLPVGLRFPWDYGTAQWDFQKGPDGWIWTYLGGVLVRIDPKDARVEIVGKVDKQGKMLFVGKDLYLAGAERLRRIKNIVP